MNLKSDETPPLLTNTNASTQKQEPAATANPPVVTNEFDSTLKWIIPATEEPADAALGVTQPDLLPIEEDPSDQSIHPTSLLDNCVTPEIPTPPLESSLPLLVSTFSDPTRAAEPFGLSSIETSTSGSLLLVADPMMVDPILGESPDPGLEKVVDPDLERTPGPNFEKILGPTQTIHLPHLDTILDSIPETQDHLETLDPTFLETPTPNLESIHDLALQETSGPNPEKAVLTADTVVSAELHENESSPCEAEVELLETEDRSPNSDEKEATEFDQYGPTPPPLPSTSISASAPAAPEVPPSTPLINTVTPPLGFDLPEALARRSLQRSDRPWFEVIFDDDYLRTLPFTTQEQTNQEIEFLTDSFNYYPGGHILDVACGYGRQALPLAKRGFQVTGIDLSLPLLLRAAEEAQRQGIAVNFIHTDMREMAFQSQFHGAYCTLTSFGYFDEETNLKLAQAICHSLKPGGRFVLDVINRDYVVADLPSRVWWEGNGCVVLEEVEFNFQTSRLLIHRSIVFNEGHQVEQDVSLRIYSLHELGKLLRTAGFRVMEISGSMATRGHFFGNASRQILLLCEKPLS